MKLLLIFALLALAGCRAPVPCGKDAYAFKLECMRHGGSWHDCSFNTQMQFDCDGAWR